MRVADFDKLLADDFQTIENILSDGILAAYLLGYDSASAENAPLIEKAKSSYTNYSYTNDSYPNYPHSIDFADGDDKRAEKAGPIDLRFDVPPAEAVDYFQRKRVVTKETFNKLEREAKAAAFTVSGVYREDILEAFKFEIRNALDTGQTQKYVTSQFKEILAGAGHRELGDYHLESITRTNMQMAYGVGRRRAMEETADLLPFWEYSAVGDDRTRPTHRALDGSIYPANHPFWDTHFPPWGFSCRCTAIARLDYPDDYDHRKPNADTTIAYDDDGLPAKAEYLTQVVDLKATKFVGVPKTSSLEKALTEAAQAAKDARLLNHQNIPQVVVEKAKEIRRSEVENLIGWDKDGNLVGHFKGDKGSVQYPYRAERRMEDGFDLHNHPPENGRYFEAPSDVDFEDAARLKLKASYVVTRNYLYQFRAPKNGWSANAIDEFDKAYLRIRDKIAGKLNESFQRGLLTEEELYDLENHLIWREVAKELKFKYKRFKVAEL